MTKKEQGLNGWPLSLQNGQQLVSSSRRERVPIAVSSSSGQVFADSVLVCSLCYNAVPSFDGATPFSQTRHICPVPCSPVGLSQLWLLETGDVLWDIREAHSG